MIGIRISIAAAFALACSACAKPDGDGQRKAVATANVPASQPAPVNGWVELPEPEGLHVTRPSPWRSDEIDIPVPGNGGDLEYKLAMNKGDVVVYSISYPGLMHPGLFVTEFHGHTEKRPDGVGDLMFYSKTGGIAEHGALEAPFDGIHGWYLKNDSDRDLVVKLRVAGFYELVDGEKP